MLFSSPPPATAGKPLRRVVASRIVPFILTAMSALACLPAAARVQKVVVVAPPLTQAQTAADTQLLLARDALRRRDAAALAAARQAAMAARHPLAMWADYWELGNRLPLAQQPELNAFYARWPGSYVEDRLRNDWLLELGRRRDWANFRAEFPRFRMNDDREVSCYALLVQHLDGQDVRNAARLAWSAQQRDPEDGCNLLASTLVAARVLQPEDVWQQARLAVEFNRPRAARAAVALLNPQAASALDALLDDPQRYLASRPGADAPTGVGGNELALLALMKLAANDPPAAAARLAGDWAQRLPLALTATAWAHAGKQAALKQLPPAGDYARRAWALWDAANKPAGSTDSVSSSAAAAAAPAAPGSDSAAAATPPWSDELLAWQVRAALREPGGERRRWALVQRAVDAMPFSEQRDSAWVYWRARAALALALPGSDGEPSRSAARTALAGIAPQLGFYGKLATEELGGPVVLPPAPLPPSASERDAARANPGLARALQLVALGLRNEGVREWNFSLRGMADRELLAAAQWACEREVWDRCINTSDRTRQEVDLAQRYPTPYREQVLAKSREVGLDPAVVYGLIRQESRFVLDARSGVGAAGLMQVMPATASWTARKIGFAYRPEMLSDRDVNLYLGVAYLKRVLDDFGGSLALAAAAYNAGPGRPRRWREGGAVMEPAAWAESIPFNETRDYVKKVLSNSVYYAAVLQQAPATAFNGRSLARSTAGGAPAAGASDAAVTPVPVPVSLRSRLGAPIGPADALGRALERDLP